MKDTRKWLICMIGITLLLSACRADRNALETRAGSVHAARRGRGMERPSPSAIVNSEVPGEALEAVETAEQRRAAQIANAAKTVSGVSAAAAVITGNTCIVGLAFAEEPSANLLLDIKHDVERAVLAADTELEHAAITASETLFARIADMPDSGKTQ